MPRIELIRTSFHRRGAEIAEGARRIGFLSALPPRALRLCGSLFLVIDLLRRIHQHIMNRSTKAREIQPRAA
jgi:hypothetical protein